MKTCSTCKQELPFDKFSLKGKGAKGQTLYSSKCRECNKAYQREHYKKNKIYYRTKAREWDKTYRQEAYQMLTEAASSGCSICGEKDFRCLQFDHIERSTKVSSVANLVSDKAPLSKVKQEIDKCRVLCANCHAKHTSDQLGFYKDIPI